MKKGITIAVLLFIVVALADAGNDLTLTYSQLKGSRVIRTLVNTDKIAYGFDIRQARNGTFTLEAPPFLTGIIDGRIRIGEIRDSGLFTLMINPMDNSIHRHGFNEGGNFKDISNPTLDPHMSGVAFSSEQIDIVSIGPVFNPQSPLGFGVIVGSVNAFAGILLATQNERTLASVAQKYQVNWEQLGTGRRMIFSILGASAVAKTGFCTLDGQLFVQNAWDLYLGGGTTSGWDVKASADLISISVSRKLGGTGVKLKRLSDDESPMDSIRLGVKISEGKDCGTCMKLQYGSDTYSIPVYGGNSQKRELSLAVTASYGIFCIKADNRILYDIDRGKSASTDYVISFEDKGMNIQAGFTLNRPYGQMPVAVDGELKVTAPHATLTITAEKTTLEMSWEKTIDDMTFKATVNQDRLITASLKFTAL